MLKIVFPSVVEPSATDHIQPSFELVGACLLSGRKYSPSNETHLARGGRLPFLLSADNLGLFGINSCLRFICGVKGLSMDGRVKLDHWMDLLVNLDHHLDQIESQFDTYLQRVSHLSPLFDLLLFSRVYFKSDVERTGLLVKCPKIRVWFEGKLSDPIYTQALSTAKYLVTVKDACKVRDGVEYRVKNAPGQPMLPSKDGDNILITSALPYVNNVPHLGNIIGCVLSADVFARYCRLRGRNVLYVCGTDEYGTATETKALEEKVSCQELCDKYFKIHSEVYNWFDIEFDYFGRTSTPIHTEIAQDIFLKLHSKGLLLEKSVQQLYSEVSKMFLADRYVEGTCPLCGFGDARGDQCDGCGKLLNAIELKDPRSKIDGSKPIVRESTHLFLDLPKLQVKCEEFVRRSSEEGFWSANGRTITDSWLKEGLLPRCITRDLKWGTPVPLDSMKEKVLYVWFDAPIGYLSITANYTSEWKQWWCNPEQVKLFQFMGKDNVPFHTVIFPSSLIGTEEPYTLLHHLSTTEYLNYEGDKFSKSRGIGVFGNNVMDSGIPASIWRYYLLSCRPECNDSTFTWSDLGLKVNGELLANLGNFVNRVLKFIKAKYASILPKGDFNDADKAFIADINTLLQEYIKSLDSVKIRHGLKIVMDISSRANLLLQDNKLDNTLFEKNPTRCQTILLLCCNVIYLLSALISPYMPESAATLCKQLNAPQRSIPNSFEIDLLPGHHIGTPEALFKRLEEKQLNDLFMKYGGEKILEKRREAEAKRKADELAKKTQPTQTQPK